MAEARTLRTAASQLEGADTIDEAQRLLERALTLTERARGPDDEQVARVAAQLADVYQDLPDFGRADALYHRALAILDRARGADNPTTAVVRSRLASLYRLTDQRAGAEALLRPALEVIEKTVGPGDLRFARGLQTLAALRADALDYERAAAILTRALAILEEIGCDDSPRYAAVLADLGDLYTRKGDGKLAEDLLRRAVALYEKLKGPDDYSLSMPLSSLGALATEREDYAAAEGYYLRALTIRERVVGRDHPALVQLLSRLAGIYRATGNDARALETYFQALRIGEDGSGAPRRGARAGGARGNTLLLVDNIARVSAAMGDVATAVAFQRRADAIVERQLALNLAVGSERQKLVFVRGISERTDRTISLHLDRARDDPNAAALAALVVLQRKGRVLDAMIDTFSAARQWLVNASDQGLLDELRATTTQLARLVLSDPGSTTADGRREELQARKERLESELAEHSAEFRAQMQPVTLEGVQAAMPADAALMEYTVFRPFDPAADRQRDEYRPPHYAVYVVRRNAPPLGLDLGPAAVIDERVDALRQALRDPKRVDVKGRARAVDERVMQPLRAFLGDATRLLISPDGELNLMPFEALVDEHGRYLIERYATSYLTSGRDLLRMQATHTSHGRPVIVADPVFGEPTPPRTDPSIARLPSSAALRGSITGGDDLSAIYFAPLAATAEEGRAIKRLFPEALLLTGLRASKASLERVAAPRMLHIASHGFFLHDARVAQENPLVRSGVALAGANLKRGLHGDGILTALEASGLNLWGTKLVTLSACDTGIGEVRTGEGVYGLRRAFVLAGAETVVMSLWPVSDSIARETMVAYYKGLRAGLGRGDALRQAKLALLKRDALRHPAFWASFIQSGEWANLDGTR
jgi:CHAT domain-containing protein